MINYPNLDEVGTSIDRIVSEFLNLQILLSFDIIFPANFATPKQPAQLSVFSNPSSRLLRF